MNELSIFIGNIVKFIIQPLLALLFALALFMFAGGVGVMILNSGDPKAREKGRRVLLWGIVGIFIMVSAVSILAVITKTFCGTAFCTVSGGL
jgi:hypothetical protein